MFVKLLLLLMCYITGTYTQIRPSCRQIDFNDVDSVDQFEQCEDLNVFGIKSYADVPFEPFRYDVENHLSNIEIGYSCFRTRETFNLDTNSEIDSIIYLNSSPADYELYVEITAFDTQGGEVYVVGNVTVSDEWNFFSRKFSRSLGYAKVKIHILYVGLTSM